MSTNFSISKLRSWFNPFEQKAFKTDHRFERKFTVPLMDIDRIETLLIAHGCSPIYHPRWINNLYCDKLDMEHLNDNIEGFSERTKLRFRWYGEAFGDIKVTAEYKDKVDDVNQKFSQKLGLFQWNNLSEIRVLFQQFEKKLIDDSNTLFLEIVQHQPSMINRYLRRYFMDASESVRVTIDTDLSFYNCQTQLNHQNLEYAIVELKSPSNSPIIDDLIPLQTSKSSKYVEGLMMTDPNF